LRLAAVAAHARHARELALPALLAFLLFGCAAPLPSESLPGSQVARTEARPAEIAPGEREHARILAAYGGAYEDARVQAMLEQMVDRLVAASERPDLKYRVTILNSPAINAFALPSGQLYVTRGLIALANDSSELASVLSHEMAHVITRHAAIRQDQARQAAIFSRVAAEVLGDPFLGALALAKSRIALASFSRAQEFEADGIGVGIAARAGFDPYGAPRFLTSMGRHAQLAAPARNAAQRAPDFLSSHPSTPERVSNAQANARQYIAPGAMARDKAAYLSTIDGLIYGDDPNEGFVRGRRFLHPKLGFTFTAPEGFTLDNTAQALFGLKEDGAQALRLDVVRPSAERELVDYLRAGWVENVEATSVEEIAINGLPAATAIARSGEWTLHLFVVRLDRDIYRFVFATQRASQAARRAFTASVASFRRLTPAEIAAAKPLRLKVVRVAHGDTVEKLARRMAFAERAVERFRVLNGLAADERLKPGELVKLVVE